MRKVACRQDEGGLWSAATSTKLLCFRLPLEDAIASVAEQTGLSHEEAAAEFVSLSLPEFYSVWSSAVYYGIQVTELEAEERELQGVDIATVKAAMEKLKATMAKREHEYEMHAAYQEIQAVAAAVNDEFNERLAACKKMMPDGGDVLKNKLWEWVQKNSPKYAELLRLKGEYEKKLQKGRAD